jgi:hypothetical protein
MGRPLVAFVLASLLTAAGCLSSSSSEAPRAHENDASTGDAGSFLTGGGNVNVDGGASPSSEGGAEGGAQGGVSAHAGFAVLAGAVRASSSAHVVVTTTGEAPGGVAPMHSTGHTIVGGIVGGTQKKP